MSREYLENIKSENRLERIRLIQTNDPVIGGQPSDNEDEFTSNTPLLDIACTMKFAVDSINKIESNANNLLEKNKNLSDLQNKTTARSNLGLKSSATLDATSTLSDRTDQVATIKVVNDVNRTANNAQTSANNANNKANAAQTRADSAYSLATTANNNANTRLEKSKNLSDLTNVTVARNNLGLGTSATLNVTSSLSDRTDQVATPKMVNDVNRTASTAQKTANTANDKANAAQTTANQAKTAADNAATAAKNADTKAGTAQTTANQAKTAAATADGKAAAAQTSANAAKTAADNAASAAKNADTKAGAAQTTANQAKTDAANAAKKLKPISEGGTGATTAANARKNLGIDDLAGTMRYALLDFGEMKGGQTKTISSPYGTAPILTVTEIYTENKWMLAGWTVISNNYGGYAYGADAYLDGNMVRVVTGTNGLSWTKNYSPNQAPGFVSSAKVRVKIWSMR